LRAATLPSAVKLLSDGRSTVSLLAERWADEKGVPFARFRYNPAHIIHDAEAQCIEWMFGQRPSGLVIFEVELKDAAAMRRRASVQCVPVRVEDTRLLVKMPREGERRRAAVVKPSIPALPHPLGSLADSENSGRLL
jgi:hypothetical protein